MSWIKFDKYLQIIRFLEIRNNRSGTISFLVNNPQRIINSFIVIFHMYQTNHWTFRNFSINKKYHTSTTF